MPIAVREQLLKNLVRQKIECAFCGRTYKPDKLQFMGHKEDVWVFMAFCTHCRSLALIGIAMQEGQPIIRDVSRVEWEHFEEQPPITADDVLDMHLFLEDLAFASLATSDE